MKKLTKKQRTDLMRKIRDEIIKLKKSPLYAYRIKEKNMPVIGDGNHGADIMFIGEAPGKNEALTGIPFCGASGKKLDILLDSIKMTRADVYTTNIVKDRPPLNRDPKPAEIELYAPFLDRQIEIVRPKVIATLGRYAMNYVMTRYGLEHELEPISKAHGKTYEIEMSYGKIKIIPLYHPAVSVYNAKTLDMLKDDFKILINL